MPTVQDPIKTLQKELETWGTPFVELDCFGTDCAARIADMMDEFCRAHLGSGVRGYFFYRASIGSTHAVQLEDSRNVVIKVRPPDTIYRAVEANVDNPTREFMWGAPGTMLAALFMYEFTEDERWQAVYLQSVRQLVGDLKKNNDHDCYVWTQELYGGSSTYLGGRSTACYGNISA